MKKVILKDVLTDTQYEIPLKFFGMRFWRNWRRIGTTPLTDFYNRFHMDGVKINTRGIYLLGQHLEQLSKVNYFDKGKEIFQELREEQRTNGFICLNKDIYESNIESSTDTMKEYNEAYSSSKWNSEEYDAVTHINRNLISNLIVQKVTETLISYLPKDSTDFNEMVHVGWMTRLNDINHYRIVYDDKTFKKMNKIIKTKKHKCFTKNHKFFKSFKRLSAVDVVDGKEVLGVYDDVIMDWDDSLFVIQRSNVDKEFTRCMKLMDKNIMLDDLVDSIVNGEDTIEELSYPYAFQNEQQGRLFVCLYNTCEGSIRERIDKSTTRCIDVFSFQKEILNQKDSPTLIQIENGEIDLWSDEYQGWGVIERIIKTGRNDPCICGSHKKFKRCCLN